MEQIKKLITALSWPQRALILIGAISVAVGIFAVAHLRHESSFRPLYTSLSPDDAGAVIGKLKESGVEYRLSDDGTTVSVPSDRQAELRLDMAAAGLPKTGRIGFELFDRTNFGTTEFVEHINYRRALEGELERSVMSLTEVEQARVHITFPKDSVFLEGEQPAKASVLVRLRPAARLSAQNTQAISHLVASAVEGLAPSAVSVLDMQGNLLARGRKSAAEAGPDLSGDVLEFRHQLERDLIAKIHSTLEPLIGADRLRVGAFVECDMASGEQTEETFDPSRSVMLTSTTSEDASGPGAAASGVPGTAANLPRPPQARPGAAIAGVMRRSENVTYQTSRTVRQTRIPQGTIRRMSVAVLVDHNTVWEGDGASRKRVLIPPSAETLKAIREIVSAATGLKPDRGDQLIVESLPFEGTLNSSPLAPHAAPGPNTASRAKQPDYFVDFVRANAPVAVGAVAIAAVLVIVRAFILLAKWRRRRRLAGVSVATAPALGPAAHDKNDAHDLAGQGSELSSSQSTDLISLRASKADVLRLQIKEILSKEPRIPAAVVRTWLKQEGV